MELSISLALISIFISFLFPLLKTNTSINKTIICQSREDRKRNSIIEIIEKSIRNGESAIISKHHGYFSYIISENFFSQESYTGPSLLINLPATKNGKIINYFLIFSFYLNELTIAEGVKNGDIYFVKNNSQTLINNVQGEFKLKNNGIEFYFQFKNSIFKNNKFVGYEPFHKKYQKKEGGNFE